MIPTAYIHAFYLIVILALSGGGYFEIKHLEAQAVQHELDSLAVQSAKLQQQAAEQVAATALAYSDSINATKDELNASLQTAAAQSASDAERLREYDAYRRAHESVGSAPSGPGAAPAGGSGGPTDDDRYSQLEQVALGLAAAGRDTVSSLRACMADRDSLTGK
jgi:hypothetical protein